MNKLTVTQAAEFAIRLTGGQVKPEIVERNFREAAAYARKSAEKAAAGARGKFDGLTQSQWLAQAADAEARAESVTAEVRRLTA